MVKIVNTKTLKIEMFSTDEKYFEYEIFIFINRFYYLSTTAFYSMSRPGSNFEPSVVDVSFV
jgi:hypothetical protein